MTTFLELPSGILLRQDRIIAVVANSVDWAHEDVTFFYRKTDHWEPTVLIDVGTKHVAVLISTEDYEFLRRALIA